MLKKITFVLLSINLLVSNLIIAENNVQEDGVSYVKLAVWSGVGLGAVAATIVFAPAIVPVVIAGAKGTAVVAGTKAATAGSIALGTKGILVTGTVKTGTMIVTSASLSLGTNAATAGTVVLGTKAVAAGSIAVSTVKVGATVITTASLGLGTQVATAAPLVIPIAPTVVATQAATTTLATGLVAGVPIVTALNTTIGVAKTGKNLICPTLEDNLKKALNQESVEFSQAKLKFKACLEKHSPHIDINSLNITTACEEQGMLYNLLRVSQK